MVDFNFRKVPPQGGSPREIASAINLLIDGKNNATGTFTLTASTTTTTVSDLRAGTNSVITYVPTTANASAEIGAGTIFISARNDESFVLTHANNSQSDRTFIYAIIG
jgi:alcohol dehydrogenase class IV